MTTATARRDASQLSGGDDILATERALISCCLTWPKVAQNSTSALQPSDFATPAHQAIWGAIQRVAREGAKVDSILVIQALGPADLDLVGGQSGVFAFMGDTAYAVSNVGRYVDQIRTFSTARRLFLKLHDAAQAVAETVDPYTVLRDTELAVGQMRDEYESGMFAPETPLLCDWLAEPYVPPKWALPGFIAHGHRGVIAAPPGKGKSTFMREIAIWSSFGVHPFASFPGYRARLLDRPLVVLVFDLESNKAAWTFETREVDEWLRRKVGPTDFVNPLFIHAKRRYNPTGNSRDERDMRARIDTIQPDIVIYGPMYKNERQGDKNWGDAAGEMQDLFDDLQERYGFALLLEMHVGKSGQDLRGAHDWVMWPEWATRLSTDPKDRSIVTLTHPWRDVRHKELYRWFPTMFGRGQPHQRFQPIGTDGARAGTFPVDTFTRLADGSLPWDLTRSLPASAQDF